MTGPRKLLQVQYVPSADVSICKIRRLRLETTHCVGALPEVVVL